MSNSLVVNSSNVIGSNNNTYQYRFLQGNLTLKDYEMSISSFILPYSWFNVSANYNNKTINFTFPTAATTTALNITLPDAWSKTPVESIHLTLYNAAGVLLDEVLYNSRLDVGILTPGLYLLKLYNQSSGETTTGKFIVR